MGHGARGTERQEGNLGPLPSAKVDMRLSLRSETQEEEDEVTGLNLGK